MLRTSAVLVVNTPKVFCWLGHMPVLNWSLLQLKEVRSLDRIFCVAPEALAPQARQMLSKEQVNVTVVPKQFTSTDTGSFDHWLCDPGGLTENSDVVLVCQPTLPFLPAAKMEACLDFVRRNCADTSCTAQEVKAYTEHGKLKAYAEIPGCRAFAPARTLIKKQRRFLPVTVNLVESLDIGNVSGHQLALAVVAGDSV